MNKKLYIFSQIVIFGLVVIGMTVVLIFAHESKHYIDLKGSVEEFCVLNLPTSLTMDFPIGYVIGHGNSDELAARSFTVFITMLFLIIIKIYIDGMDSWN